MCECSDWYNGTSVEENGAKRQLTPSHLRCFVLGNNDNVGNQSFETNYEQTLDYWRKMGKYDVIETTWDFVKKQR